jgi:hypothetical protein
VLVTPSPPHPAEPFWPLIHGEPRVPLPSLTEFLVLLLARGRLFDLRLCAREPLTHADQDGPLRWLYQQLFVAPDTAKGQRLASLAREAITSRNGRWALSWARSRSGSSSGAPLAAAHHDPWRNITGPARAGHFGPARRPRSKIDYSVSQRLL